MSSHKRTKKDINNLTPELKEELVNLRKKEKELLDNSGYLKWRTMYISIYLSYAGIYFIYFIYNKKNKTLGALNLRNMLGLFLPSIPIGTILMMNYVNHDIYKEYYKTHIELNRFIKLNLK